ncbi:ankyrin-3 [Citrus clementina]|uniref:ankyrin-3 n=1 Tax=Citrus clementina TaxID=85681 RepID=UPI000CED0B82|nr:ankyrin-3 [Citrus x clementina]
MSQPPVDLLRMENAMGNTALREALFMLGRVNVCRTNTADVLQLINQHKSELLLLEDRNRNILYHIFEKVLPDGSSLLHVAAKSGHDTPLQCAARAGKLNTATALVDFAMHIPSMSQPPVDLLRMENAMGNTALREALFMLGRVNVCRTNTADVLQLINQHKSELLLLEDRNRNILYHIFKKVLPDGSSLLHVAAKSGHGDTPLQCAARAGKLNTAAALVDFAMHIPSMSQPPVDLLRMENVMGNIALREALFMLGRVNVCRTNTAGSFLTMVRSYFLSNPTLAIDDTIKTNIINSLVAIAHFLVLLDPKLSCCKNIEDKSPLSLAIKMGNTDVLEYILRSLPSGVCYLLEVNGYSALKKNKETLYPIHLACKNGHLNVIVELLKEWRCPSLFVTDNGCNILHFAAKNGHANMVKAIIEIPETNMTMDEVVNKMDEDGNTPLHLASLHGHSQVVYALLRYGRSNHDLKNKQSMTTYKMALREYYMQTSIAEKQEKSMKLQTTDEKSIGRVESLGASSRKSNENQDQLPIAYGESSGASAQRSHEFQDKLEKTLSIFLVTTRILKGESMPFLNPLLVGKLSEKEVQGFRKTLLVVAVLILGIAYSASEKMPSLDDAGSSNSGGTFSIQKLKTMIKKFLVFDNVGMNSATIAVLILLWAQIVKHSSTFKMVLAADQQQ